MWGVVDAPDRMGEVHTTELSYFSRQGEASVFRQQALVETHRRSLESSRELCAVTDGVEWSQSFMDWHRPDAKRILDFCHAAEYVAEAGRVVYGEDTPAFQAWFAVQRRELRNGDSDVVLQAIRQLLKPASASAPAPAQTLSESARQAIETGLNYLLKRRDKIACAEFQRAGYSIGSGAGEACHKVVIESRMKGSGMRRSPAQVNPMAALRNLVCNNRWDEGWAQIMAVWRQQARDQQRQRRAARVVSAPAPAFAPALAPSETPTPDPPKSLLPPGFKLQRVGSWRNNNFIFANAARSAKL